MFLGQVHQGQAVQVQTSQHPPAQQPRTSVQAAKDSLLAGGLSGEGGILVNVTAGFGPAAVTAGSSPAAVTAGSRPQQQPRGPYNKQVLNHSNSRVLMA